MFILKLMVIFSELWKVDLGPFGNKLFIWLWYECQGHDLELLEEEIRQGKAESARESWDGESVW